VAPKYFEKLPQFVDSRHMRGGKVSAPPTGPPFSPPPQKIPLVIISVVG